MAQGSRFSAPRFNGGGLWDPRQPSVAWPEPVEDEPYIRGSAGLSGGCGCSGASGVGAITDYGSIAKKLAVARHGSGYQALTQLSKQEHADLIHKADRGRQFSHAMKALMNDPKYATYASEDAQAVYDAKVAAFEKCMEANKGDQSKCGDAPLGHEPKGGYGKKKGIDKKWIIGGAVLLTIGIVVMANRK